MTRDRWFHLLTFAVATFAVVFQLVLVLEGHHVLDEHSRPDEATRLVRFWSYLTIWGNVLVAGSALALALGRLPGSRVARALRLDAVVLIAVVGVVHFLFLRPLLDLSGDDWVADKLLHMVVPVLGVLGWVLFGPRGRAAWSDLGGFLVIPVVWLAYTLVRGEIVEWYPYPFIDVNEHGYGVVLLNCAGVAALMTAFFAGALWLDTRLSRDRRGP
ncbi:Pr6Pr family membrane protein [Nocardioides marmorisolisilvae]|uniref:F420-dependent oxidoreductase n=1 Tax=Nocardioides marmorisolisilvae TaxID=1542737 RepID=A0A3N0DPM0_9ACTN|nr:Pr6Pr family membrane protein [Nocardioides marmorisolisilvae]RNL77431.1 F420-dependent oxidoreductase [Nocardioides marmorisolisilvae]